MTIPPWSTPMIMPATRNLTVHPTVAAYAKKSSMIRYFRLFELMPDGTLRSVFESKISSKDLQCFQTLNHGTLLNIKLELDDTVGNFTFRTIGFFADDDELIFQFKNNFLKLATDLVTVGNRCHMNIMFPITKQWTITPWV